MELDLWKATLIWIILLLVILSTCINAMDTYSELSTETILVYIAIFLVLYLNWSTFLLFLTYLIDKTLNGENSFTSDIVIKWRSRDWAPFCLGGDFCWLLFYKAKIWSKQRKKILIVQGCSTKYCFCLDCRLVEFNYESYSLPSLLQKEAVFCFRLMKGSISGWIWVSRHADGVVNGSWHNLGTLAAFPLHFLLTQSLSFQVISFQSWRNPLKVQGPKWLFNHE